MSEHPVYWHEGMFLTPQHFQAADRWQSRARQLASRWDHRHNWGVHSIEIDTDALRNHRLVVRVLQARMPDGSQLAFPEDGSLPVLDLKEALGTREKALVYVGLPLENSNRPGATDNVSDVSARHVVEAHESTDENTGTDPQTIQVLRPNVRLLLEHEDLSGYDALPILRVRRSEDATGAPEIDPEYIPPVLACDAWAPLQIGVLTRLLERLEKKADVLASQAVARDLGFDSLGQGERLLLEQLRILQEAVAVLSVDVTCQGVAPLTAYRELARIVGRLSVLSADKRAPRLPVYDHDDLGGCFLAARREIELLLSVVTEPSYRERAFSPHETLLHVDLEAAWLEPGCRLYLGVETSLAADEAERLLASGRNVKFGSGRRANELFLLGEAGLEPRRVSHIPRALPVRRGLTYYELLADGAPDEWRQVELGLSLAARVSEHLMVDTLTDHNAVVLNVDGRSATLKLSLFALRDEPAAKRSATPTAELASV